VTWLPPSFSILGSVGVLLPLACSLAQLPGCLVMLPPSLVILACAVC
jgi:hypothetical protein